MALIVTKIPLFKPTPVKVPFDIKVPFLKHKDLPVIKPISVFKDKKIPVINPVRVPLPMPVFKFEFVKTPLKVAHPEANHIPKPVAIFDPVDKPVEQTFIRMVPEKLDVNIIIPRPMIPSDDPGHVNVHA